MTQVRTADAGDPIGPCLIDIRICKILEDSAPLALVHGIDLRGEAVRESIRCPQTHDIVSNVTVRNFVFLLALGP